MLSANEYREFLTFYPTNPRADYAQYKLAMTHFEQMRAPERDQTETQSALREFQIFFERYPMSPLIGEVRMKWREARDRLSSAEFRVGIHYFRIKWYPGAIPRFRQVLSDDPAFTGRDEVYFYLAESSSRADRGKRAEAIPYFERLLAEFRRASTLEDAKRRLEELKTQDSIARRTSTDPPWTGRGRPMTSRILAAVAVAGMLGGATVGGSARSGRRRAPICQPTCSAWRARPGPHSGRPDTPLRITGGQDSSVRTSHAPGDLVTINAGSQNGIEVGQEFYTRRLLDREP